MTNEPTIDTQGLADVGGESWSKLDRTFWFTYRGGRHGARFMAYLIGSETGGESELPPPSLKNLEVVAMYAERDGWVCHLCGEPVARRITDALYTRRRASPDHLIPRSEGGSDYPSNIKTAHLSCNKSRRNAALTHGGVHE